MEIGDVAEVLIEMGHSPIQCGKLAGTEFNFQGMKHRIACIFVIKSRSKVELLKELAETVKPHDPAKIYFETGVEDNMFVVKYFVSPEAV